jgi:glycosyltransferase A (GT-A) superfamily protein (DUF2064 family)
VVREAAVSGLTPICVFAKPAVAGLAKTRLASRLGAEGAARLAAAMFADTWALVRSLPWARPVLATTEAPALGLEVELDADVWLQGEGTLDRRIERILGRALDEAPYAFALGADSPGLPTSRLVAARGALAEVDAAVGPSSDGGFYLLAVRRLPRGTLAGVPWSHPDTARRTVEALGAAGLSARVLEGWFDVDEPGDLDRLRCDLVGAPETARVLAELLPYSVEVAIR